MIVSGFGLRFGENEHRIARGHLSLTRVIGEERGVARIANIPFL